VAGAFAVVKWSRHSSLATEPLPPTPGEIDRTLQARLDQELEDLD
jgi:hypothetical protein